MGNNLFNYAINLNSSKNLCNLIKKDIYPENPLRKNMKNFYLFRSVFDIKTINLNLQVLLV